jgi:hypothetical protein
MHANPAVSRGRLRHFDRGQRLLIVLAASLLLAECSRNLGDGGQTGSAGSPGTGQGGAAGTGGGGTGGGGTGGGGTGGGGTGGLGGAAMLPACPTGTPTFSVCVVSDADVMPFPDAGIGGMPWSDSVMAAAAVEAVGMGAAPAQCRNARVFGAEIDSDWWLQVRTTNNVLWTIGLGGLGNAPVVQAGQSVRLDLEYLQTIPFMQNPRYEGYVQLSDTGGTPLLWAGSNRFSASWLSLTAGQPLCNYASGPCRNTQYDVIATVNGSAATVAPFSAAYLGGYYLAVGQYYLPSGVGGGSGSHTECAFTAPPAFAAAAVKAP